MANGQTQLILKLVSEETMIQFGASIAAAITAVLAQQRATEMPDQALLIALQGDLGVGKTTLSRGILTGLGTLDRSRVQPILWLSLMICRWARFATSTFIG